MTDFQPGQRVRVVVRGRLQVGPMTIEDSSFDGVTISRKNPDGTYQVRGMIKTPETDEVTIPAEWIEPI